MFQNTGCIDWSNLTTILLVCLQLFPWIDLFITPSVSNFFVIELSKILCNLHYVTCMFLLLFKLIMSLLGLKLRDCMMLITRSLLIANHNILARQ
jgi:hypothetical protein